MTKPEIETFIDTLDRYMKARTDLHVARATHGPIAPALFAQRAAAARRELEALLINMATRDVVDAITVQAGELVAARAGGSS
jgi:hypothetical protein